MSHNLNLPYNPVVHGRIAIGEKGKSKDGKLMPKRLDYFDFRHNFDRTTGLSPKHTAMIEVMTKKYGERPKEIEVILKNNTPEEVFFTGYMNYPGMKCNCFSRDGFKALRTQGESKIEVECNHKECNFYDHHKKTCKPTGILTCVIEDSPVSGGVWKFTTHSKMSIQKITSALATFYECRGTLFNLAVRLKVVPVPMVVNGQNTIVQTVECYAPHSLTELKGGAATKPVGGNEPLPVEDIATAEVVAIGEDAAVGLFEDDLI